MLLWEGKGDPVPIPPPPSLPPQHDSQDDPAPSQPPGSRNDDAGMGHPPQDQHTGAHPAIHGQEQEGGVPQQMPAARQEAETTGNAGQPPQDHHAEDTEAKEEPDSPHSPTLYSFQYQDEMHDLQRSVLLLRSDTELTEVECDNPMHFSLLVSTCVVENEIALNNDNVDKLKRSERLWRDKELRKKAALLVRG